MAAGDAVRTGVELNDVSGGNEFGPDASQPPRARRRTRPWAASVLIHAASLTALMFLPGTEDPSRTKGPAGLIATHRQVLLLTPYLSPPILPVTIPRKPRREAQSRPQSARQRFTEAPRRAIPRIAAARKFIPPPKIRGVEPGRPSEIGAAEVPAVAATAANPPLPLMVPKLSVALPPPLRTDNLDAPTGVPAPAGLGRTNAAVQAAGFGAFETASGLSRAAPQVASTGLDGAAVRPEPRVSRTGRAVGGFESPAAHSPQAARVSGNNIAGNTGSNTVGNPVRNPGAQSSFGDATIAGRAAPVKRNAEASDTAGIEILSKPRPAYTAEARKAGIEGEVLIEMMFTAAGDARVVRIVRGLGHGLDETAVEAARAIRFRPASRGGQAVDADALLHISFQLAY